ncbi:alpha/beta-Hydrolases superfamily protein [Thalictrum thalictroides]|uniref:Alpha/beta-Hydrolases superfamily protein n=1 Tax=Thalictrum thalictroides TaxID=46969 RepID=A0A7J6VA00_THATH|nr:alpha/beta-Hydrolases superfamily protein [Thalictrum thalictroides]
MNDFVFAVYIKSFSSSRWVRAVDEFFSVLHSTPFMHKQKERPDILAEPLIDQGPYISLTADGMVSAMVDEGTSKDMLGILSHDKPTEDIIADPVQKAELDTEPNTNSVGDILQLSEHGTDSEQDAIDAVTPMRRHLKELSRRSRKSMWLLAYIAVITTWPFLGSALLMVFKRKVRNVKPSIWFRK